MLADDSEIDCTFRTKLFGFLKLRAEAFFANPDVELTEEGAEALLTSFSNMLTSLDREMITMSSNSTGNATATVYSDGEDVTSTVLPASDLNCTVSLVQEARAFAAVMRESILKAALSLLQNKVPGEEASMVLTLTVTLITLIII